MTLENWGWIPANTFKEAAPASGLVLARVTEEHGGCFRLQTETDTPLGEVSGKFKFHAKNRIDFPVIGDWVWAKVIDNGAQALIEAILPRRSSLERKTASKQVERQALASNIDYVFVVHGMTHPLNLRRLERYFVMVRNGGAIPVLVLNKVDQVTVEKRESLLAEIQAEFKGLFIHATSVVTGEGIADLRAYLSPGKTGVFVGLSGVGKSSLVNLFLGENLQDTRGVREKDQRGRHTTTRRQLWRLPGEGLIIDTPGLRELGLLDGEEGLAETFQDVESFAAKCQFRNCTHNTEPGCAVKEAVLTGNLPDDRYKSYLKLAAEKRFMTKKLSEKNFANRKSLEKVKTRGKDRRLNFRK